MTRFTGPDGSRQKLGEEGDVDGSMVVIQQADALKVRREGGACTGL
jgi:hypothetical protein